MIGKPDKGERRPRKNGPQLQRQATSKLNSRGNAGFSRGKRLHSIALSSGEVIASLFIPMTNRRGSKYSGGMA